MPKTRNQLPEALKFKIFTYINENQEELGKFTINEAKNYIETRFEVEITQAAFRGWTRTHGFKFKSGRTGKVSKQDEKILKTPSEFVCFA